MVDWTSASCTLAAGKVDAATRLVPRPSVSPPPNSGATCCVIWNCPRAWTTQVKATGSSYYRVIGAADGVLAYAEEIGQRWLQEPRCGQTDG
ncbi:MAG: hypothetical protein R3F15_10040 [Lysobacterales bacterium]